MNSDGDIGETHQRRMRLFDSDDRPVDNADSSDNTTDAEETGPTETKEDNEA
jgi:hypothetical protein